MKKVAFITGITGMVGSHLADFLIENTDWDIVGLIRWRSPLHNISNLIENAINYSPDSTRVAITLKVIDAIAEIAVSDQGIGIPEKDLERIFERFYRVDPARSRLTGGTGLGLSIVKHIATNHGGDVSLWSVEGAGSTFTIRFPLISSNLIANQSKNEGK